MVTYRQAGRGLARTLRAIDRDAKRAQRQRLLREKAQKKHAALMAAADAVDQYETLLAAMTEAHRIDFRRRDWLTLASETRPEDPRPQTTHADAARAVELAYKPDWFARTLGLEKRQRARLGAAVAKAQAWDQEEHKTLVSAAQARRGEIDFANRLIALDRNAVMEVLDRDTQLAELPFSVEGARVAFSGDNRIILVIDGLDLEDMPENSVTLLQSGRASIRPLSRVRVLELHRDALCAAAVRVALEALQALPLQAIEVVMQTDLLDLATGHIEAAPVLYLHLAAQAVGALNLARAEPAALVERLGGHFAWNRRQGFMPLNLGAFDIPIEDNDRSQSQGPQESP